MDSYSRSFVRAFWQGHFSDSFKVGNGVRQGGVLSPLVFNLYMDELIKQLESSGYGCYIGHIFYGALGYADDLTLLAPTIYGLQKMLKICEKFGMEYDVKFNPQKTVCITFSNDKVGGLPEVMFAGKSLQWASEVKHLGNFLQSDLKDTKEFAYKKNDIIRGANSIIANFQFVSHDVKITLFNAHCSSLYGSQAWDLTTRSLHDIEVKWRVCARSVLGLHYRTHNFLIPMLLAQPAIKIQVMDRFKKMIKTCMAGDNTYVQYLISNSCREQGHIGKNVRYCDANVPTVTYDDHKLAQCSVVRELLDVRDGFSVTNLSKIEVQELLDLSCTYI